MKAVRKWAFDKAPKSEKRVAPGPRKKPAPDRSLELFKNFIGNKKILIVDDSAMLRSTLVQVMKELGAKPNQLVLAPSFEVAEREIARLNPGMVLTEYDLGKRCGVDLLASFIEPGADSVFMVMTGNVSISMFGRVAEEGVDALVLKPFNVTALKRSIVQTALMQAHLSRYSKDFEEAQTLIRERKADEVVGALNRLNALDPSRALAFLKHGQGGLGRRAKESLAAEANGVRDYVFYRLYYEVLVSAFNLMMDTGRDQDAYQLAKRMFPFFPANPRRLATVLKLAIKTRSFEDIDSYYELFREMDQREAELVKAMCVGLVMVGKHYLWNGQRDRALELFKKAVSTAGAWTNVIREVVLALIESDMALEAQKFLKRYPPELQNSEEFLRLDFMILDKISGISAVIRQGRQLIANGVHHPSIFRILIRRYRESGHWRSVEALAYQAASLFPGEKAEFIQLIQDAEKHIREDAERKKRESEAVLKRALPKSR